VIRLDAVVILRSPFLAYDKGYTWQLHFQGDLYMNINFPKNYSVKYNNQSYKYIQGKTVYYVLLLYVYIKYLNQALIKDLR
jgi:hypothetical protein